MTTRIFSFIPVLFVSFVGCQPQGLTAEQALEAKDEMQIGTESEALTSKSMEITTNFTIGDAVDQAAEELHTFMQSQWPCADVVVQSHTLTITYGAHGSCPYNSYQSITGTHEITISKNDRTDVEVDHVWTNLSNGDVEVSGTAHVTWNLADPSRHAQHDLTWTRLSDHRTGEGTGDVVQTPLDGDLTVGFAEDGHRSWTGQSGEWDLDIAGLQMRWVDPVPQAGSLTLQTPFAKTVDLSFSRVSDKTIQVILKGPRASFDFDVSQP